jgi:hypothetical protein
LTGREEHGPVRTDDKGDPAGRAGHHGNGDRRRLDKIIPVRLPADRWEQMRQEAGELGIGPTTLARVWILDRLRRRADGRDRRGGLADSGEG